MIEPLYVAGASFLHRLPAGLKLAALALAGVGLFLLSDWRALAGNEWFYFAVASDRLGEDAGN